MPPPDYRRKVYVALKDNLSGFTVTEENFNSKYDTEPGYNKKVYRALSENLEGFSKSEDDFYQAMKLGENVPAIPTDQPSLEQVDSSVPTPGTEVKQVEPLPSKLNSYYANDLYDIDPDNVERYQKALQVLPGETNKDVRKLIGDNTATYESFANRVIGRYNSNTNTYDYRDGLQPKEGDIVAGDRHGKGLPGLNGAKFAELKNGQWVPTAPNDPLFGYDEDQPVNVVGFKKPTAEQVQKISDAVWSDDYQDDKYPELSKYILNNARSEGGRLLKPFLDSHSEVAEALKEEIGKTPAKDLTPEGSQDLLSAAIAKAYQLDQKDLGIDQHPETNREQFLVSMNVLNEPVFQRTLMRLDEKQQQVDSKIKVLNKLLSSAATDKDRQSIASQINDLKTQFETEVEKSKPLITEFNKAASFLSQPEQAWVKQTLQKQETGNAILSNLFRFFPESAGQEYKELDLELRKGDNTALYLLKKFTGSTVGMLNATGSMVDKVLYRPFLSEDQRKRNLRLDADIASGIESKFYTNESGRGDLIKGAGFLSSLGGYMLAGVVSPQASMAGIFADTYEHSLHEAHTKGLEGAGAEINAGLHGMIMSTMAHLLPNITKAAGKFEIPAGTIEKLMQGATRQEGVALLRKDMSDFILKNTGNNLAAGVKTQAEFAAINAASAFVNSITNQVTGTELNDDIDIAQSAKDAFAITTMNTLLGAGKGLLLRENIKKTGVRNAYLNAAVNGDYNLALEALDNLRDMHPGEMEVQAFTDDMQSQILTAMNLKSRADFSPEQNVLAAGLFVDIKNLEKQKESSDPIYSKGIDKEIAEKQKQLEMIAANPEAAKQQFENSINEVKAPVIADAEQTKQLEASQPPVIAEQTPEPVTTATEPVPVENEQNADKAVTGQRIPVSPITGKQPKQLSKILFDVSRNTKNRVQYVNPQSRKAAGSYSPGSAAIKIKFANDLDTTAHEIGHAIDDRFGVLADLRKNPNPTIEQELHTLTLTGGSKPPKGHPDPAKYLRAEGLAEFIRGLVVNPNETKRLYPNTWQLFDSKVDAEHKKAIDAFSEDVRTFYGATGRDMILANIEWQGGDKKGWLTELFNSKKDRRNEFHISFADKLNANLLNPFAAFNKAIKYLQGVKGIDKLLPADNPELLARGILHTGAKVDAVFTHGMIDRDMNVLHQGDKPMNLEWLIEPLDKADPKTLENEMKDTMAYMVSERTMELAGKFQRGSIISGIGGGIVSDIEVANKMLNEFNNYTPEKQARLKQAAQRYRDMADAVMYYMVDKGRLSEAQFEEVKKNNLQYVAMKRILETEPEQEVIPFLPKKGTSLGSRTELLHSIKGSTSTIQNPYTALLDTINKGIREADRNEALLAFRGLLVGTRSMYAGETQKLSDIGVQAKSGDKNTIAIFVDGKPEYWRFQEDVYKSLKALDSDVFKLPGFITALPKLLRWSVVHSPIFAARNIVRDTQDRLIKSNENSWSNAFGIKDLSGNKEHWRDVALAGGLNSGYYLKDKAHYDGLLQEAVDRLSKDNKTIVLNPLLLAKKSWKGYEALLQKGETLNRVAEYRAAFRKARAEGLDDYNAMLYAGNKSADLIDFALAGHWMRVINQVVPFSNATVQGLRSSIIRAKEAPGAFAARMIIGTTIPQVLLWALAHKDEKTAKEYENLPDYQRDMFWNLKVADNLWISIPKAYELGVMASGIDRALSYQFGNKNAFDGYTGSVAKSVSPLDEQAMAGPYGALVETITNYDFFTGRHVISKFEEGLNLQLRNTERASRLGKAIGQAFGLDPRQVDHVIKSTTSYIGGYAMKASNIGREDGEQFRINDLGFFKNSPAYSAKSVKVAMDLMEEYGLFSTREGKELIRLAKATTTGTNEEKEQSSKVLREYAESILENLKQRGNTKVKIKLA